MPDIEVELVEKTQVKANVTIPGEEKVKLEAKATQAVKPKVKIAGFRQGKVPDHIIKQKFPAEMREELLRAALSESVQEIEEKADKSLYTLVKVENVNDTPDTFAFTVFFDLNPYVEPGKLKEVTIRENTPDIARDEVKEEVRKGLHRFATFENSESAPIRGDRLTVDYEVWLDEAPQGEPVKNRAFVLGDGFLTEEFEKEILKKPAKKDDEFRFEKETENSEGKKQKYEILMTVRNVEKAVYPDLTDKWVKENFPEFETIADWEESLQQRLEKEFLRNSLNSEITAALNQLEESSQFYFPDTYLEEKLRRYLPGEKYNEAPDEEKADLKKVISESEKRQLLIDTFVKRAQEGKDFRESFEEYLNSQFDPSSSSLIMTVYDSVITGREEQNQELTNILNNALTFFYNYLIGEYFKTEGLVKKGKKMSMGDLEKKLMKEAGN